MQGVDTQNCMAQTLSRFVYIIQCFLEHKSFSSLVTKERQVLLLLGFRTLTLK